MKKIIYNYQLEERIDSYMQRKFNVETYLYFEKESNKLFTGKAIEYYDGENTRCERIYKKGKLYREIIYVHKWLSEVINYKNGIRHGKLTRFGGSRNIMTRENYQNGLMYGRYTEWSGDNIRLTVNMVHGKMDGLYVYYHWKQIAETGYYNMGKQEGIWKEFDTEGKLISQEEYLNGERWFGKGYDYWTL